MFPNFYPPKQERAAALAPGAAVCPLCPVDLKREEHRDFLPELTPDQGIRQWYRTGTRNAGGARWHRAGAGECHPGLPAVRSQVSGRFGAVPAPPDASQRRSQARHKVHGLRQGVGDKCPQGNGGVTATSLCLCHRGLGGGGAERGRGCRGLVPGAQGCLDAPGPAGPPALGSTPLGYRLPGTGQDTGWPGWGQADRARLDHPARPESGRGHPRARPLSGAG